MVPGSESIRPKSTPLELSVSAYIMSCTPAVAFTANDAAKSWVATFDAGELATATCDPITGMKLIHRQRQSGPRNDRQTGRWQRGNISNAKTPLSATAPESFHGIRASEALRAAAAPA